MEANPHTIRRRLGLDTMALNKLHDFFDKVRYDTGPIAEAQRTAIVQVLEERVVGIDVLATFLEEK